MQTSDELKRLKHNVGVIIGRFQVPKLHEAHKLLIQEVEKSHETLIILLGVSVARFIRQNPLPFLCRLQMIKNDFPNALILPINDHESDAIWVENLDNIVSSVTNSSDSILLYGSRDSFLSTYDGIFDTCELASEMVASGTAVREQISRVPVDSLDFRKGIIYSIENL